MATALTESRSRSEKCSPTPNIIENDADFGKLQCNRLIRDVPGGEGANNYACDDISDEQRDFQAVRDRAKDESQTKAYYDRSDQCLVGHRSPC